MCASVKPISNFVDKAIDFGIKKPLRKAADSKVSQYVCDKFNADTAEKIKFASGLSVGSIILKDGAGCYMYVNQSLNNEKIPEDKRKFVAALDLANGALMIGFQLLMAATISKESVQKAMFNKTFGKYFNRATTKSLQAVMNKNKPGMTGDSFHKAMQKYEKEVAAGFGGLTTLLAASVLGKRVLVPFVATPLADKTKTWMSRNDKPPKTHKDTANNYDKKGIDKIAINTDEKDENTNLLETKIKKTKHNKNDINKLNSKGVHKETNLLKNKINSTNENK
ncbi:MAG: hypothetical protein R3Y28_03705 [Candidatus Gastranaerophilales bacterium]